MNGFVIGDKVRAVKELSFLIPQGACGEVVRIYNPASVMVEHGFFADVKFDLTPYNIEIETRKHLPEPEYFIAVTSNVRAGDIEKI